ncbi:MAG: PD40 domain-containing protein [Ardenticatenaceae bacterium]|nr:PD40 domain-containing protein [Ardenticatenaceae bacterium]
MTNSKNSFSLALLAYICLLGALLVGCSGEEISATVVAEATPLATHSPTATLVITSTPASIPTKTISPTEMPSPTYTATPTTTPFPTVTPPPTVATKTVLLQYGITGGDGGSDTDLYYGRGMPRLVIYTDGQMIFREGNWREEYFLEATVSPDEMCDLLAQLQEFGFFENYDPIYAFDETTEYSDGAGAGIIHVNGPLSKRLTFYGPYEDYLIPPLKQSAEFISDYRPSVNTLYMPERLVLWVEVASETLPENAIVNPWPDTLPQITDLWQDPINGEVLVEGELVAPIMELFDYRMSNQWFSDEGVTYSVILRPLLPNETPFPQLWDYQDYAPHSFNLPFSCPGLDMPIIDPTRAPLPIPDHKPIAQLTGQGRILFDSLRNGNSEIYVMNADGTNVLNLTNHLANDEMAVWSPDGQKIAFVSNRNGNDELYVMNADGTNVTRTTYSAAREIAPKWSPDGKQLIYMSNRLGDWRNENWQLFVVDVETGVEYQFTQTVPDNMYAPDWSPDGENILFSSGRPDALRIFMLDKNGENKELMGIGTGAVWSPDGQHIAFLRGSQINLMNADGTDLRKIWSNARYTSGLNWSSDGSYLVYASNDESAGRQEIYAISVTGEELPIRLTFNSVEDSSPAWSP